MFFNFYLSCTLSGTSASIKFRFIDEDRVAERSKRFSMSDDGSTVAESMQKGLDSLECPPLQYQLNMSGQNSIRVPPPETKAMAATLPPSTPTSMAAALPPSTPTSMAATSPPSTPTAMAAPPPPYDRVLTDDGSAESSTKAKPDNRRHPDSSRKPPPAKRAKMAAVTGSEIDLPIIELNPEIDSKALQCVCERMANLGGSWIMSVRRHPLYTLAENILRLVPAIYEEARVPGISTTTTVSDSTDKRQCMDG
uniref:Uncharacterized protein n=1 Tax=Panagrolaimus davidi TaxID=227884 RepID=A0A914PDN4_9BILA